MPPKIDREYDTWLLDHGIKYTVFQDSKSTEIALAAAKAAWDAARSLFEQGKQLPQKCDRKKGGS